MKHRLARIKKGFTLLELTVVIATTSILLLGFTAFTIFFSNQYDYEMTIDKNENSAVTLKYAISNNIDRYNYNFEREYDFKLNSDNQVDLDIIFTGVLPTYSVEEKISSATIKEYFFRVDEETNTSYFGFNEYVYKFTNVTTTDVTKRDIDVIREELINNPQPDVVPTENIVYKTKSRMHLKIEETNEPNDNPNAEKYLFTIDYDFEKDDAMSGKQQLIFNKYVYFIE